MHGALISIWQIMHTFVVTYLAFKKKSYQKKKKSQHTISLLAFSLGVKERSFWTNPTKTRQLPCPKQLNTLIIQTIVLWIVPIF